MMLKTTQKLDWLKTHYPVSRIPHFLEAHPGQLQPLHRGIGRPLWHRQQWDETTLRHKFDAIPAMQHNAIQYNTTVAHAT